MFNQNGITKVSGLATKQILADTQLQFSVSAVIGTTGAVTVGSKKYQLAGTPVYGDVAVRSTAFVPETTTSEVSNAVGVLLHDVDVTNGNANGQVLLFGFVQQNRVEASVLAKYTPEVKKALNKITFIA